MKVVHVLISGDGIGGTAIATRRIGDAVRPLGVQSSILLLGATRIQTDYFEQAGISCLTEFNRPEPSLIREAPRFLRDSWRIARACAAFDVVHCADVFAAYQIAAAGRLARRPVVCHVRNRQAALSRHTRIFVNLANHFAFVSSDTRQHFPMRIRENRTSIIYDGVEMPRSIDREGRDASAAALRMEFGLSADTIIAAMFARVNQQKDYETLIQAAAILRDQCPRLRFLLVGDNDRVPANRQHFQHMQELARAAGVLDLLIFTGHRDDVQRIMLGIDICVLCTHFEGLPLVLLEAMAMGLPCVATAVDGVPEALTDQVTGLLHAHGDAAGLAAAIMRLVNDKEFSTNVAVNARRDVERRFGQERFGQDVYTLYAQLTGAPQFIDRDPIVLASHR